MILQYGISELLPQFRSSLRRPFHQFDRRFNKVVLVGNSAQDGVNRWIVAPQVTSIRIEQALDWQAVKRGIEHGGQGSAGVGIKMNI